MPYTLCDIQRPHLSTCYHGDTYFTTFYHTDSFLPKSLTMISDWKCKGNGGSSQCVNWNLPKRFVYFIFKRKRQFSRSVKRAMSMMMKRRVLRPFLVILSMYQISSKLIQPFSCKNLTNLTNPTEIMYMYLHKILSFSRRLRQRPHMLPSASVS